jgi:hypothetical protein
MLAVALSLAASAEAPLAPTWRVAVASGVDRLVPIMTTTVEFVPAGSPLGVRAGLGVFAFPPAGLVQPEASVRVSPPSCDLVCPQVELRVCRGYGGVLGGGGAVRLTHVSALIGARVGRDRAFEVRAGPLVGGGISVGQLGTERGGFSGISVLVGGSFHVGPQPPVLDTGRLASVGLAALDAEIVARRERLTEAQAVLFSTHGPAREAARQVVDQARLALYEALEARRQLRRR